MIMSLWNIVKEKESLWIRWIHGKYLEKGDSVWSYTPKSSDSWLWKRLIAKRDLLLKFVSFQVGDGLKIRLWRDPWINGQFLSDLVGPKMCLALGKGSYCLVESILEQNYFCVFTARRL